MKIRMRIAMLLAITGLACPAFARSAAPPLQWLAGSWRASAMGGTLESSYVATADDEMLGTLRQVVQGKVVRYEFRTIRREGDAVVLRIVQFGPDMTPLAAVPPKRLIEMVPGRAVFEGLRLERSGRDGLTVTIATPGGPPAIRILFQRVAAPGQSRQ